MFLSQSLEEDSKGEAMRRLENKDSNKLWSEPVRVPPGGLSKTQPLEEHLLSFHTAQHQLELFPLHLLWQRPGKVNNCTDSEQWAHHCRDLFN